MRDEELKPRSAAVHAANYGIRYLSVAHCERLGTAETKPSTGAAASSHDNTLVESLIGLDKTELVNPHGP